MLGSYTINCPVYGGASTATRPRQSFDVAKTNPQNQKHWANADALASVSDLTPAVRGLLRRRSRYECLNNPYASGLVSTLSNDLVGTGPRLQVHTDDDGLNSFLEQQWRDWSDATLLAGKLRLMDETRQRDGECFGVFFRNVVLEEDGLPCLDVKLIEGDQVAHPYGIGWWDNPTGDDGVICDENGLPKSYLLLKVHPGDQRNLRGRFLADELPARDVLHWFRPKRPGQLRGYPELTAALPMFAYLRRIDLATLAKEEIAASLTAVLETDMLPEADPTADPDEEWTPFEQVAIDKGLMTQLPHGWKLKQFDGARPAGLHGQYVDTILRAIGRAVDVPFGVVAGDYSKYNFSSGKLDRNGYDKRVDSERGSFRMTILNRIFRKWFEEMRLLYPAVWMLDKLPLRSWHFDARPSIDPLKDANAAGVNLLNGVASLTEICAAYGKDVEDVIRQRAKELALFKKYGVVPPVWMVGGVQVNGGNRIASNIEVDEQEVANAA